MGVILDVLCWALFFTIYDGMLAGREQKHILPFVFFNS